MLLEEALARFARQLRADGRSPHTVRQYERHVRALARWAAEVGLDGRVGALDHDAVARFMTAPAALQRPDGRAKRASSVNALRTSLRCFFGYLHEVGAVAADPARRLRRARCAPPPPRGMADGDLRRLVATLRAAGGEGARRDLALVRLLAESGMRLGSALALDVEDLDLDAGEAHPRQAKGGAPEPVVLPKALRAHLRGYLAGRATGPLFPDRGGRRVTARHAQRRLAAWLERAGARRSWGWHSLRHRFALRLYRRTGDLLLVQQALGHRSPASTAAYARADRSSRGWPRRSRGEARPGGAPATAGRGAPKPPPWSDRWARVRRLVLHSAHDEREWTGHASGPACRRCPLQLRHSFATRLRKSGGLEDAQLLLGHQRVETTQIYAERDMARALALAKKMG